jgi:hypothetical protein
VCCAEGNAHRLICAPLPQRDGVAAKHTHTVPLSRGRATPAVGSIEVSLAPRLLNHLQAQSSELHTELHTHLHTPLRRGRDRERREQTSQMQLGQEALSRPAS